MRILAEVAAFRTLESLRKRDLRQPNCETLQKVYLFLAYFFLKVYLFLFFHFISSQDRN